MSPAGQIRRGLSRAVLAAALLLLSGCTSLQNFLDNASVSIHTEAYPGAPHYPPTTPAQVQVLAAEPPQPNVRLGAIFLSAGSSGSGKMEDRMKEAAAPLGADAVFVVSDETLTGTEDVWNMPTVVMTSIHRDIVAEAIKCQTEYEVTHYTASARFPYTLVVATPTDHRKEHLGERVAGTKWTSSSTDALSRTGATQMQMIRERLVEELASSGLFSEVTTRSPRPEDVVLRTEIHVFSSRQRGFVFVRVVGMSVFRVSLERNGKVLSDDKFERVVTDADTEYTGSQIELVSLWHAMGLAMADSLRELMKEMLQRIEANAARWDEPSNK